MKEIETKAPFLDLNYFWRGRKWLQEHDVTKDDIREFLQTYLNDQDSFSPEEQDFAFILHLIDTYTTDFDYDRPCNSQELSKLAQIIQYVFKLDQN